MLPTPSTSHVNIEKIYEPSEDSFLFLDALSQPSEISFLQNRYCSSVAKDSTAPLILEVGTGSGVVLAFIGANAGELLGRSDVLLLGTDVNEFACRATGATVGNSIKKDVESDATNGQQTYLGCVNGDLTSCIRKHSIDMLVFNPPYVPSEEVPALDSKSYLSYQNPERVSDEAFESNSRLLALATDGGKDGMEVTERLLRQLPFVLHPTRGVAYILLCAQNRPENVKQMISNWSDGWIVETIRRSGKQGGWEKLQIIRVARR